jgi:hypothetical protein
MDRQEQKDKRDSLGDGDRACARGSTGIPSGTGEGHTDGERKAKKEKLKRGCLYSVLPYPPPLVRLRFKQGSHEQGYDQAIQQGIAKSAQGCLTHTPPHTKKERATTTQPARYRKNRARQARNIPKYLTFFCLSWV